VENARSTNHTVGTKQLDKSVGVFVVPIASLIRLNVTQISDVPIFLERATMRHFEWVVMWAGSNTAFKQVAVLVNMKTVFVAGCQSSEISFYRGLCEH
jgi:hypothetical protein